MLAAPSASRHMHILKQRLWTWLGLYFILVHWNSGYEFSQLIVVHRPGIGTAQALVFFIMFHIGICALFFCISCSALLRFPVWSPVPYMYHILFYICLSFLFHIMSRSFNHLVVQPMKNCSWSHSALCFNSYFVSCAISRSVFVQYSILNLIQYKVLSWPQSVFN